MKASNNHTEGGASYGNLLSLFGRKLTPKADRPVADEVTAPEVEPEVLPSTFAQGRRILIADDDPVFSRATENRLKAHGFRVSTALDGSSVLQAARSEAPDVILLDLEFPPELPTSWDGFTIMEWLNQMNWFPNTPIIICTGRQDPDLLQRAKALRAAGVFHKPLDYPSLLGMIEFHLNPDRSANFQLQ